VFRRRACPTRRSLTRKSSGSSCRICRISRLWRTLQRAVVAFMPPLAGRRDESRRGTLKRAPQRCVETRPTFIPMGGQTGHGDSFESHPSWERRSPDRLRSARVSRNSNGHSRARKTARSCRRSKCKPDRSRSGDRRSQGRARTRIIRLSSPSVAHRAILTPSKVRLRVEISTAPLQSPLRSRVGPIPAQVACRTAGKPADTLHRLAYWHGIP
jgi:hypothetical protein